MATDPLKPALAGTASDPKALEFLTRLKEKTIQKKISWKKSVDPSGFLAALPDGVAAFFFSTTEPPWEWTVFNVYAEKQTLLSVRKTLTDAILVLAGGATHPVQAAIHDLFLVIAGMQQNPLDKALQSINKL